MVASDLHIDDITKELSDNSNLKIIAGDVTKESDMEAACQVRRLARAPLTAPELQPMNLISPSVLDEKNQLALSAFSQLDAAVMNAGIFSGITPWTETDSASFDPMFNVNVKGAFITAKYAVRAMLASPHQGKGGSLVFVASVASL